MRPHYLFSIAITLTFLLFTSGCVTTTPQKTDFSAPVEFAPVKVDGLTTADIDTNMLVPGLSTVYYLDFFKRDLKHLPPENDPAITGMPGKPILQLNHQFGSKKVFDSGTNRGVGLRMNGYLHFGSTGVYELQALSNDGLILYLDGQTVITDPRQHSDRLSNIGYVTIEKAGWYTMKLEYFQRKGTAALKLLWKEPGSDAMRPVPAKAYGHLK